MLNTHPLSISVPLGEVVFAESMHAPKFQMELSANPYHKLIYILEGQVSICDRTRAFAGQKGDVFFIVKNKEHKIMDVTPATLLLLCISDACMDKDVDLKKLWKNIIPKGERIVVMTPGREARKRVEALWRRALVEKMQRRDHFKLASRALATEILIYITRTIRPQAKVSDAEQRVASIAKEIDAAFYKDWTLDQAADQAFLSRRQFSTIFRKISGRTFHQYLQSVRMRHASSLLKSGNHSIMGAMFACGINDLTTFYRQFRKQYNCSPGKYDQ